MAMVVRPATADDDPAIAAVARATGQSGRQSGADHRYTAHLRERGALGSTSPVSRRPWPRAEARLTGADREADLTFMAGDGLVITRDGQVIAAGAVSPGQLEHLACLNPSAAAEAVIAGLRMIGDGSVCLPGPHPAVSHLLAAGFRIVDFDVHMATRPHLLDISGVYSPSLG